MHDLWSSASYEAHLLSLPFALAPAAMLIVIAYTIVMRGSTSCAGGSWRTAWLSSLRDGDDAVALDPIRGGGGEAVPGGGGLRPMAAAAGTGFRLALVRKHRGYRWLIWFGVANAAIWVVISSTTGAAVSGVQYMRGFWYAVAGPWAWLALLHTMLLSIGGFLALTYAAVRGRPAGAAPAADDPARQLRHLCRPDRCGARLRDRGVPAGLAAVGNRQPARGPRARGGGSAPRPRRRYQCAAAGGPLRRRRAPRLGGARDARRRQPVVAGDDRAPPRVRRGPRVGGQIGLVNRGGRAGEGPLERLLEQLVTRARTMVDAGEIAQLAIDITQLAIGVRPHVLLATETDWGWTTETGDRLADDRAPDPFLISWLAEQRGALFSADLDAVPPDLRELVTTLFERHDAIALVPIGSVDELIGLVIVPSSARRLRGRPLAFLERTAERLAEALLHARMAKRAATRASLAREVELAATVQGELLPGKGPHVHGDITVIGSWQPATRCAGDFWCVYPLGDGRVLVAIGDVTGHGVASAMVTAAAIGACDVFVRRSGAKLQLTELTAALDIAVRRVGGGELAMTCFAAILDPTAREIRFVSCGHTAPYLCRPTDKLVELHALVGRGNPLGSGVPTVPKVLQRPLQADDLVVWYTDGVIEAQDPAGTAFGDRRFQQLLKRLDRTRLTPAQVHDLVQAGVAAHRAGHPLADDETVVVAQLSPPLPASLEPSREASS
ncbi:MAG: SpoIIE family protein phosphatase [Myxococcales bacterium]|nr:SpoIIE family protein phosphatase [Myxococcales bacterium]